MKAEVARHSGEAATAGLTPPERATAGKPPSVFHRGTFQVSLCGMRLVTDARRLTAQIECGIPPIRVLELETMLEQSGGNNAAALQNELGFRTHEDGTDLEHPFLCREAKPGT